MDKMISWSLALGVAYLAIIGAFDLATRDVPARCELKIYTQNSYRPIRQTAGGRWEESSREKLLPRDKWIKTYSCDCDKTDGHDIPVCVVWKIR